MKLLKPLLCLLLLNNVDSKFIRKAYNYPSSLISIDSLDSLYVIEIPYCKINFCQVRDLYSIINIKSTESSI